MDLVEISETVMYFKCPADCLTLSQTVSFCTDIFRMSEIVSTFCLKLSQNKQGTTTGDIFNLRINIFGFCVSFILFQSTIQTLNIFKNTRENGV